MTRFLKFQHKVGDHTFTSVVNIDRIDLFGAAGKDTVIKVSASKVKTYLVNFELGYVISVITNAPRHAIVIDLARSPDDHKTSSQTQIDRTVENQFGLNRSAGSIW